MNRTIISYVPHGINTKDYHPILENDPAWGEYQSFLEQFKTGNDVDFIVFWNNRNVRRKQPGDVILAFRAFCDKLPRDKAMRCALLMHTNIVDENGTDLVAVKKAVAGKYKVIFSDQKVPEQYLNFYYNLSDVTINIASNEGFGLSSAESLMTGTPIVNNCTGGLQDQMRFSDEVGDWIEFDSIFQSNHMGRYRNHGVWAKPVYPSNRSLQGSPQTPYIFDDRADFREVADALLYWYEMDPIKRAECGIEGRKWLLSKESGMSSEEMSRRMHESIEKCFELFIPRKRFELIKVTNEPKIDDSSLSITYKEKNGKA